MKMFLFCFFVSVGDTSALPTISDSCEASVGEVRQIPEKRHAVVDTKQMRINIFELKISHSHIKNVNNRNLFHFLKANIATFHSV